MSSLSLLTRGSPFVSPSLAVIGLGVSWRFWDSVLVGVCLRSRIYRLTSFVQCPALTSPTPCQALLSLLLPGLEDKGVRPGSLPGMAPRRWPFPPPPPRMFAECFRRPVFLSAAASLTPPCVAPVQGTLCSDYDIFRL